MSRGVDKRDGPGWCGGGCEAGGGNRGPLSLLFFLVFLSLLRRIVPSRSNVQRVAVGGEDEEEEVGEVEGGA